jgi:uncharacterized protein
VPQITAAEFRSLTYPGESFGLDTGLTWIHQLAHQEESPVARLVSQVRAPGAVRPAFRHLPIGDADEAAVGRPVPFFRDWLAHNQPGNEWCQPVDYTGTVSQVTVPVHLLGGWYDISWQQTIADYARQRQADRQPYLPIGPWAHTSPALCAAALRESITWFSARRAGERGRLRKSPVRALVMGANEWSDLPEWPPAGYLAQRCHLQPGTVSDLGASDCCCRSHLFCSQTMPAADLFARSLKAHLQADGALVTVENEHTD